MFSSVCMTPGTFALRRMSGGDEGGGEEVGGVGGMVDIAGFPRFRLGDLKEEGLIESMVGGL
jgi:hypothetical protein